MLKRLSFWVWTTSILQLLTACFHSLSFFVEQKGSNATEDELLRLMKTYKMDLGAGFTPTMLSLFTALSACFTLVFALGGWMNLYLWRKRIDLSVMRGVLGINLVIFGICFAVMAFLTFLPPTLLSGLVFVFCLISWLLCSKPK